MFSFLTFSQISGGRIFQILCCNVSFDSAAQFQTCFDDLDLISRYMAPERIYLISFKLGIVVSANVRCMD